MNKYFDSDIDLLTNEEMGDDIQFGEFNDHCHNNYDHNSHHHCHPPTTSDRINAFLNIKGQPYVLNDYLEDVVFKQIDQAFILNSLSINTNENNRTVVTISIDDTKPIIGNRIKYSRLIESIFKSVCGNRFNILPVLQKSLIVQINYQLENQRTGEILRSAAEKLDIKRRDYFIDINVKSISDNAIDNSVLTNFKDSLTTTVTEFLHGSETMICRITGISLFYPAVMSHHDHVHHPGIQPRTMDGHMHHNHDNCHNYQYNDLYHFDNHGSTIHLHQEEINDKKDTDITLVPVGSMKLDKIFPVNTGHRITFDYSIWKSDVIMVKNCRRIAEILGGSPHRKVHKTIEDILDRLDSIKQSNYDQDIKLENVLKRLDNTMEEPEASDLSNDIINSYKSNV